MKSLTKSRIFQPARINLYLRWSHYVFSIMGILALSYCGFALLDARLYQAYQNRRFDQALNNSRPSAGGIDDSHPSTLLSSRAVTNRGRNANVVKIGRGGSPLGRIEIIAIGLSAIILEGTDHWTLQRAVGHIPETALPGEIGNTVLAGHRDTFFRSLRNIRMGEVITLKTLDGDFQYRVESSSVVPPSEVRVLEASNGRTLTLITCFPFHYVGPAPNRFVVRAREVESSSKLVERENRPNF
jgi:sortase A